MTRDEFDQLVGRLEAASKRSPRGYLLRIVALLTLAYGYLVLVLIGSLAVLVGTIAAVIALHNAAVIKLAIFLIVASGGLFWAVLRGLWVRLEAPAGVSTTPAETPQLFALLDELRTALNCAPFHRVLLVPDPNAAVVQIPRLGIFGWHTNYLLLGLPLMQSLAPDEFKAVLAHEFAHSSRGHGSFGNWLYRLRRSWGRIIEQMARQGTGGGVVLGKFLNWFWPLFNAHAFVLARANEYEADASSVRFAGADAAARALMRLPVDAHQLEEKFWPAILARANQEKLPPPNVMQEMAGFIHVGAAPEDATRWLKQAFLSETNNHDTHPCTKDRLRAIGRLPALAEHGEVPPPAPPITRSAAEFFLGDQLATCAEKLSREWQDRIMCGWIARHAQAKQLADELSALKETSDKPLTLEELWEKARKLMELHGDAEALPVLERLLALQPSHAVANFVRGRQLLQRDDPVGIDCIERALASNRSLTPSGCELLYRYYSN